MELGVQLKKSLDMIREKGDKTGEVVAINDGFNESMASYQSCYTENINLISSILQINKP